MLQKKKNAGDRGLILSERDITRLGPKRRKGGKTNDKREEEEGEQPRGGRGGKKGIGPKFTPGYVVSPYKPKQPWSISERKHKILTAQWPKIKEEC